MPVIDVIDKKLSCYHCGNRCPDQSIKMEEKVFCCDGCRMVYGILEQQGLCDYYALNNNPGITQQKKTRKEKFAFLDDEQIKLRLIDFEDDQHVHLTFYLPQMHCSSCLYLLENIHRVNEGIISGKVNFARKEIELVFLPAKTSLRGVAETLASIGYEPYISLNDLKQKRLAIDKSMVYQVGVAGFCFGNIMLMSFPEYFGIDAGETSLRTTFRWINFGLAIPVLLYAALPFYQSSVASLKQKYLNIDAPIALAIIITFIRSAYEVISGTGGGYFDSMSGIVFFMLAGRILQNRTYRQLSFDRDYTSYFPVAIAVLKDEKEVMTTLPGIRTGDTLVIHNEELIPADSILTRGSALIDYSFVTGESLPVLKEVGEIVYAGGKQTGGTIEMLTIKEVAQSYLTRLWNGNHDKEQPTNKARSFIHLLSRYFTYIVFAIAVLTAVYWQMNDATKLWPAVTAIFIIACPCALLLSSSFTSGNILRILSRNQFYLKNAETIEAISDIDHIVFDKTGTLTDIDEQEVIYTGDTLTKEQLGCIAALAACSTHPLSRALVNHIGRCGAVVERFKESTGQGIEGTVKGKFMRLGSFKFITGGMIRQKGASVFLSIDNKYKGCFSIRNHYRDQIIPLLQQLTKKYRISVLSGDDDSEKPVLEKLLGKGSTVLFHQKPEDKLNYIAQLQQQGEKIMMVGDGLNDAGALKQSDAGVAVTDQTNNFTPASDGIIRAEELSRLSSFIRLCKANRTIIVASFILSIIYNIVGLYFAVQGTLSPLIAAILMPSSSLSILLLTFGSSQLMAKRLRL